jgi:hypothetical protein
VPSSESCVTSLTTCWVVTLAGNLDADVQARIRELREGEEREQLAAELGKVKLERDGFAA